MSYAGDITPRQAWELLRDNPEAVLVDVRTEAEWRFVGVPDTGGIGRPTVLIEWVDVTGSPNTRFTDQLEQALAERDPNGDAPVIFICRSGQRSIGAATAATAVGFTPAFNVVDGFEGALDAQGHRGGSGWRAEGLPWRQS
ncbi:rhodanese-like domain-containing protein [Nocardia sp. CC227C]|uniref:rhodanese-like domain-containing protein n=1 Tax=Nocardia sp. CC227C TaxID=3044562 RepID=UPI00278BECD1|nr:rhodanese-like domain-containing protein [Nocardia sp. CC227C]